MHLTFALIAKTALFGMLSLINGSTVLPVMVRANAGNASPLDPFVKEEVMNQEEILQMSEGRKMRELIATLVMGWELYEPEPFDDRPRKYWRHPGTKESRSVEAWCPDENMTDAWMVVEFIEANTEYWAVGKKYLDTDYSVEFAALGKDSKEIHAHTGALAICRAALILRILQ